MDFIFAHVLPPTEMYMVFLQTTLVMMVRGGLLRHPPAIRSRLLPRLQKQKVITANIHSRPTKLYPNEIAENT